MADGMMSPLPDSLAHRLVLTLDEWELLAQSPICMECGHRWVFHAVSSLTFPVDEVTGCFVPRCDCREDV